MRAASPRRLNAKMRRSLFYIAFLAAMFSMGRVVDLSQYVARYPLETLNVRCRISPGHQSLFLSPRDGKEVFEDLAAHRGHDGLGMELEAEDGVVLVCNGHDLTVLGAGGDGQAVRDGLGIGGEGMVTGGLDDARHAGKEGAFRIEDDVIRFAVDELFRIGDGGTEGLTDGLMAKADTEDGELSGKVRDRGDGDAGIFGTTGTGGRGS